MEGSTFLGTIEMESLGFNYLGSFQSSHYYQSTSSYTWNNAKTTAESYNYTLVIINSEGENNFLYNNANISSSTGSWIGLYQDSSDNSYSEPSGGWKWVDGTGVGDVTTYLWSTNSTAQQITVSPFENTDYWVDITTAGVTCRETVTISVTDISLPSGNKNQSFCDSATISDLVVTGQNIQWLSLIHI